MTEPIMTGADLIRAERLRQIDAEGWTPQHDDTHVDGELVRAAICYAEAGSGFNLEIEQFWPWEMASWKPGPDCIRNLAKAGALIAAEIDRQLRRNG
jgi:hypothetical protein